MSRLPAATAALNVTTTKDVDTLVDGQTHTSSNCLPFSVSQFPPAQQSHSTTIPRDTNKVNQTDDEQCGVDEGYRAKSNKQADDEQFDVRNDTTAGKNSSNQTDDEQREVQYVTEASGIKKGITIYNNRAARRFAAFYTFNSPLYFSWLQTEAGLAKQIKEKFPSHLPIKNECMQQVLHQKYLGTDKFVLDFIVKQR